MFNRIIFVLVIVSSLSCNLNRCAVCFQSFMNIACRSYLFAARIKRFSRLHIVIKPLNKKKNNKLFMLKHNAFNVHCARGLYDKQYGFTSDVMCKKYKRLVYISPDLLARFYKVNLSKAKNSA